MTNRTLPPKFLAELCSFSTCVVSSSIEKFDLRLRNIGFADSRVRCMYPELPPVAGFATTARMRSTSPPMEGGSYYDRTDWWEHILSVPGPRIAVIEDMDNPPGLGAFIGEVHASILRALGCVAVITNGAMRDLREVRATGIQAFAGNISVSHAYAHVFEFGGQVQVGHLRIKPGDLLHGDLHGILHVPTEVAEKIPEVARTILTKRRRLVQLCRSEKFNREALRAAIKEAEA
ncbi:MAG TPA: RraA family protein [Verrucomicrobiae bacterium]|nr:RraA family protein [Verrucomicrobiae bacterium]